MGWNGWVVAGDGQQNLKPDALFSRAFVKGTRGNLNLAPVLPTSFA
jgi:hypothetical protein